MLSTFSGTFCSRSGLRSWRFLWRPDRAPHTAPSGRPEGGAAYSAAQDLGALSHTSGLTGSLRSPTAQQAWATRDSGAPCGHSGEQRLTWPRCTARAADVARSFTFAWRLQGRGTRTSLGMAQLPGQDCFAEGGFSHPASRNCLGLLVRGNIVVN